ncbi:MAG: Adenosine monophosphate-protein transferase SoFic [Tenericutes bacterium ADurb.Bin239]|nr:MAG: Adenosine monophosphate-protein transferase SoFic [Tenericutes bacterium ADurb.Bin239]
MRKFTYTFLKDKTITASLFSLSNIITDLKGKVATKKKLNKNLFNKLNSIAIKESVVGSNAIEGIFTTQKRIKEIIEDNSKPLTHSEEEIAGYHDAIRFVTENYEYLDFNEETIKRIHALLVGRHVGFDKGGKYKTSDNVIARTTEGGTIIDVIFVPIKAKDVEKAMKDFCLAYQVARDDYDIPSLLLIPCVIMDFLSIHPFSDGNGRVSRLLTLLLLYKEGYDIGKYISLENQINQYRDNYYHALQRSQKDWYDSKNTYYPFIEFTFQILYQCYKEMNKRIMTIKTGKEKKSERIAAVVLDSIVPLSKRDIKELLPDVSVTTIEVVLAKLLKANKIYKIGTYKNAKYFKK